MSETTDPYGPGSEHTPATNPVPPAFETDPLVHGLGQADDPDGTAQPRRIATDHDVLDDESLPFGLGSEHTQDTPQEPLRAHPDPLEHGLGSADSQLGE